MDKREDNVVVKIVYSIIYMSLVIISVYLVIYAHDNVDDIIIKMLLAFASIIITMYSSVLVANIWHK